LKAALERGPRSLIEYLNDHPLPKDYNLLILADQFEEIFRFTLGLNQGEADSFVALLLAAAKQREQHIYVVITMRSDFIGDCARFPGLPEAVNEAQFLTPRLTREQSREAIEGPARVFGGAIELALVNRLLNDMGTIPDQLPLMQHALMRMWTRAVNAGKAQVIGPLPDSPGETSGENTAPITLTLDDYVKIGGLSEALSNHANEAYNELEERDKQVAQILFRVLTERGPDRSDLRRPTRFGTVVNIVAAGKSTEEASAHVKRVVEAFRRSDRSFITPAEGRPLEDFIFLDISHESLIRRWDRLNLWAKEEAYAADTYRELLPPSLRWQERKGGMWKALGGLWRGQDLRRARTWRKQVSTAWSALYGGDFCAVEKFIRASRIAAVLRLAAYIALITLAFGVIIFYQQNTATRAKLKIQERLTKDAEEAEKRALKSVSRFYATMSLQETIGGYSTTGMILALQVLPSDRRKRPYVHIAERALYAAMHVPHEIAILEGHEKGVKFGAFSPDGKWVVTGSWDGTARLWNTEKKAPSYALIGHEEAVVHVAFSPKGNHIVTSSRDNTARIWETESQTQIHKLSGHKSTVWHADFSPKGDRIVTASSDTTARIWDVQTGNQLIVLQGHTVGLSHAVFSPNGTRVLTASWDKTARIWDPRTGNQLIVLQGHTAAVRNAAFSPNGDYVITASEDKTARIWDAETGIQITVLRGHKDAILHTIFNPQGDRVVTASRDHTAWLWNAKTGDQISVLSWHTEPVRYAAFSPKGDRIVTASEDKTACLWDGETGEMIYPLRRHEDKVLSAVFSPQGDRVVTVSQDKKARIWYATRNLLRGHTEAILHAAFSPERQFIVTTSQDATVRIWDAESMVETHVQRTHKGSVLHVAFSSERVLMITASKDGTARIWDAKTGAETHVLRGHKDVVLHAVFSPKGDRLVTVSKDKTARIWDAETGAEIHVLNGHTAAVLHAGFSPKGNLVASASEDKTVRLWDTKTGKLVHDLSGHASAVLHTSFSPDGSRLVAVSKDKTALLWTIIKKRDKISSQKSISDEAGDFFRSSEDMDFGPEFLVLSHKEEIHQAMFSPKGERVVTASEDGTAIIWDAITADRVAVLDSHKGAVGVAVFSLDGERVLTATKDGTAYLWEVFPNTEALVTHAQEIVKNRDLTTEEYSRIFPY
jgi:WD40 repeat protein